MCVCVRVCVYVVFILISMYVVDLSVGLLLVLPDLMYHLDHSWVLHNVVCKLNEYVKVSVVLCKEKQK